MSRISSISSVNGSSFDGRAEAVVVRGCGQAEVRALLTVLQVTPYLHCNARFDMPSRESRRSAAYNSKSPENGPWATQLGGMFRAVEEFLLRLKELLFPSIADVAVLSVDVNIALVRVDAQCTADGAACPVCGTWSTRIHGFYLRFPADVPSGGRRVVLQLRVRRFTCGNSGCTRRTFGEQIPGLTRRHSRRTERLRSTLASVGLALAGRVGARIARVLGVSISRSTVLRLVDALPEPEVAAPRVVGVDEYATRKGRHYGTILIDVETRRPVDLLPDREASSLAAWLAERPGIEVICRDRAPFFAEGASAGAPQAVQVADRWHLWHNVSEAAERAVAQHRHCLRMIVTALAEPDPEPEPEEDPSGSPWPTGHRFADRTRARHADVHALLEAGHSRRSVQRQLGMTWRTVKQLADAARPEELFTGQWQNRTSVLDDYKPYLDERWNEGCTNAWKLWEEIVPLGYKGSYQRAAPTCTRSAPHHDRWLPGRPRPERSPDGFSGARKPFPRLNKCSSKPFAPTAPRLTRSPGTSALSPSC
ncbi:ISL3 family transposase [Streptomyces phaeochromogenes]|uniref:ISL3 family transposase n=1 Tax=Streptomyces phaeochromogenes TaxID=1923 RepID=UPI00324B37EA